MNNYFETQPVHWHQFSPNDIYFKSNYITKSLLPEENVISWKTKTHRHEMLAEKCGVSPQTSTNWKGDPYTFYPNSDYKSVLVQLTNTKKEYVCANVDFVNYMSRTDSQGSRLGSLDVLVYINSWHWKYEWKRDAQGNYQSVPLNKVALHDDEGYRIAYGGQGDSNYLTHRELLEIIDISESVRKFLIDRVLPFKRKETSEKTLKNLQVA